MRGPNLRRLTASRRLRVNQTDAEAKLWSRLKGRQLSGAKFVRQEPVGRYVCDFVCREMKLVVEADGGQHSESKRDLVREDYLSILGYRTLRFWNNDILSNIEGVLSVIESELGDSSPSPRPSPR